MDYYDYDNDLMGAAIDVPSLRSFRRGPRGLSRGTAQLPGQVQRGLVRPGGLQQLRPLPGMPGAERQGGRLNSRQPLGFPTITFDNASLLNYDATSRPQRMVKPVRLVVNAARTAGAPEAVTITSIKVGADEMLPTGDPIPIEAFTADAVDTKLILAEARPGYDVTISFQCAANPVAGESIVVNSVMFCDAESGQQLNW
jgi:hypothetical protein